MAEPRQVVNDSFLALRGGAELSLGRGRPQGLGRPLPAGKPNGDVFRTLGPGSLVRDFGGATDVSEEAERAVANAYTGRGPSAMLTNLPVPARRRGIGRRATERLSRRLVQAGSERDRGLRAAGHRGSECGDLVTRDILERVGGCTRESAVLVAKTLDLLDLEVEMLLSGGLIIGASRFVTDPFEVVVKRAVPRAGFVDIIRLRWLEAVLMAVEMVVPDGASEVQAKLAERASRALWGRG